jgi:hypothetical protein
VEDVTSATLRFATGAVGSLATSSLLRSKARASLELVGDGLRVELTEASLTVQQGTAVRSFPESVNAKELVDRAFVDAAAATVTTFAARTK